MLLSVTQGPRGARRTSSTEDTDHPRGKDTHAHTHTHYQRKAEAFVFPSTIWISHGRRLDAKLVSPKWVQIQGDRAGRTPKDMENRAR